MGKFVINENSIYAYLGQLISRYDDRSGEMPNIVAEEWADNIAAMKSIARRHGELPELHYCLRLLQGGPLVLYDKFVKSHDDYEEEDSRKVIAFAYHSDWSEIEGKMIPEDAEIEWLQISTYEWFPQKRKEMGLDY